MFKLHTVLTPLITMIFIGACASGPATPTSERRGYKEAGKLYVYTLNNTEDCLPKVREAGEGKEISPEFSLILNASEHIFSCERVLEGTIKFWGKPVEINGHSINASYGYALSDTASLPAAISGKDITESYSDTSGKFKVRVSKTIFPDIGLGSLPIYEVYGKVKMFQEKRIAVITAINFKSQEDESLTLILWAQDLDITVDEAFLRFNILVVNAIHPQS